MLQASDYWKPDDTSWAVNEQETCQLGKANLFNTSLSKKDRVYTDKQTGSIISANARIDNKEILLEQLNINSDAISDGELIFHAYHRWGKACAKYLLGDFVFIIWDNTKQKVFCARDHFGIKVLLYSHTEKGVMVSNEPNSFFTSGWLQKSVKEPWLIDKLWGLGSSPVATAYENLEVVPPGHYLEIDANGVDSQAYWMLADHKQWDGMSDDELLREFKKRLYDAVSVRLDSDYPLACELSEGLDSNAIAGFAAKIKPKETIYTLSYQCEALTEKTRPVYEKTYKDIFEMLNLYDNLDPIWTEEQVSTEDIHRLTSNTAGAFDLKGGWLWHCKLASKTGSRVLFSGWGGDHCVSTYGDFYESELFSALKWRKVHRLFQDKHKRGRGSRPYKAWAILLLKNFTPWLYKWFRRTRPGLEQALLKRSQYSFLKEDYIKLYGLRPKLKAFNNGYHNYFSTKAHHRRELFDIGVEQRLIDSELSARMYRVEFRYPLLDVPLVEFAYNLPSHLKIHMGIERYAFREILKGYTTERIRMRLKADVDHPNIEILQLSDIQKQDLKDLLETPFYRKYCHTKSFDSEDVAARFVLFQFKWNAALFQYYADNNVAVKKSVS
ncbi:MAG: asparagine synthase-related protein [Bacteroidota bacterium]|nr:asparagine synthase-related protein [Bacteroidota bacterium]